MLRVMHASLASDIRSALERGFDTGQILGAYLFCGPPGTGKRATSLWWMSKGRFNAAMQRKSANLSG